MPDLGFFSPLSISPLPLCFVPRYYSNRIVKVLAAVLAHPPVRKRLVGVSINFQSLMLHLHNYHKSVPGCSGRRWKRSEGSYREMAFFAWKGDNRQPTSACDNGRRNRRTELFKQGCDSSPVFGKRAVAGDDRVKRCAGDPR